MGLVFIAVQIGPGLFQFVAQPCLLLLQAFDFAQYRQAFLRDVDYSWVSIPSGSVPKPA